MGELLLCRKSFILPLKNYLQSVEDFHGPLKLSSLKITDSEEDNLEIKQLASDGG